MAVARVTSEKAQVAAARQAATAASAGLTLVKKRHAEGKLLLLEVFDAERRSAQASDNLVRAICAQNRAQFRLHRLLGGSAE